LGWFRTILVISIFREKSAGCSKAFKHGRYNTIVTIKGLYEDMYVLEIDLSISPSGGEHIQGHIGSLISKFDANKKDEFIEMISNDTSKTRSGAKRKRSLHNEGMTTCDDDIITAEKIAHASDSTT
jgi:hypothetical protein